MNFSSRLNATLNSFSAYNARINCGVNLAAFLPPFAKKKTSLRSQI
jgi:hypothetical protein